MKLVSLMFCVLALSACKTTVQDGPRKVVVEDNHDGGFCPPGQAKKGNC